MSRLGILFVLLIGLASCTAASQSFSPAGSANAAGTARARHGRAAALPTEPPCTPAGSTTSFTVKGSKIMLTITGKHAQPAAPFFIKGVDYSPTQIGSTYMEPLDDSNSAYWMRDLPNLQAMHVNAIHVYHAGMYQYQSSQSGDWYTTPMDQWLTAAWNHGSKPIYTIVSITIPGSVIDGTYPQNAAAVTSLANQYYMLARYVGCNPDIMGIAIGGEWNQQPYVTQAAAWTRANQIINGAYQGLKAVGAQKIITTALQDDVGVPYANSAMYNGELNDFPTAGTYKDAGIQFAWGYDVYSSFKTFFDSAANILKTTKRPLILSEWGESVGYHPYPSPTPVPGSTLPPNPLPSDGWVVEEWPSPSASPSPAFSSVVSYLNEKAKSLYAQFQNPSSGARASGGFYFEWSDEWWQARKTASGRGCSHIAGNNAPAQIDPGAGWPSGYWDNAWFGLNAVALPASAMGCPASNATGGGSTPDTLTQRGTFAALRADFKGE